MDQLSENPHATPCEDHQLLLTRVEGVTRESPTRVCQWGLPGSSGMCGGGTQGPAHVGGTGRGRAWGQKKPSRFFSCCCLHLAML